MGLNRLFEGHIEWLAGLWFVDPGDAMQYYVFQYRYSTGYPMDRVFTRIWENEMARGKSVTPRGNQAKTGGWTEFVTIPLNGATKDDITREFGDGDSLTGGLEHMLKSGYRVGVSYDAERDAAIVSVTCRDDSNANSGCTFTSFAQTWPEALAVALYKHFIVCNEKWPRGDKPGVGPSFG